MAINFAFGFQFNPKVKMSSLSRARKSFSHMLFLPGEVKHRDLKTKRQPSRMTCSSMMVASMMGRTVYPAPRFEKKKLIRLLQSKESSVLTQREGKLCRDRLSGNIIL